MLRGVYERAVKKLQNAPSWVDLKPNIRAVAINFSYQGTSHLQMREIAKNNTDSLIKYIKDTPHMNQEGIALTSLMLIEKTKNYESATKMRANKYNLCFI